MAGSERLYALDAARFVAMLLMIQGHTLDALVSPAELDIARFPWNIWHFMRGLTAPIFLVVSGIVHVLATPRTPEGKLPGALVWRRIRSSLTLLGIGYLMMFPAQRLWHLGYVPPEQWTAFFRVHILQLIGVTLLCVLGLMALTRTERQLSIVATAAGLAIVALAPAVAWVDWYRFLPEALAAYLSTERGSLFPFVPFAAYPFLGLPIGSWLKSLPPAQRTRILRVYLPLAGLGVLALAPVLTLLCQPLLPPQANPYHANPGLILLRFGLALLFLGAIAWLYELTPRLGPLYAVFGRYALFLFVGHLVLLYGTPWFHSVARLYAKSLSLLEAVGVLLIVVALCFAGVFLVEALRRRFRPGWLVLRLGIAATVTYLFLAP